MTTSARHNQLITLFGIRLRDWDSLLTWLPERSFPPALLVSDVTLGAWSNQHVAHELAGQLNTVLPGRSGLSRATTRDQLASYGQLVGQGIDAEAEGDRHFIDGVDLVKAVSDTLKAALPHTLVILLPRQPYSLGRDNIVFIYLLAQALSGSPHKLILATTDDSTAYDTTFRWNIAYDLLAVGSSEPDRYRQPAALSWLPGIVTPPMRSLINDAEPGSSRLIPLANGRYLIRPEDRPASEPLCKMVNPVLQSIGNQVNHVLAYCQYYGGSTWFLVSYAWQMHREGNTELGLRLLERCERSLVTEHQKGIMAAQVQGMRIASMRFAEAAGQPLPLPGIPVEVRSVLHQTIGWGKAMTGNFADAEIHFDQAQRLRQTTTDPIEQAYFNNIRAFAHYRSGNVNQAMLLEKAIEVIHQAQPQEDYRLTYINSINQARLYRHLNDYYNAHFYYEKAFATTVANRSESDLIYTHICRALLNQDRGQNRQGFVNWLRAALYWVAASYPEAIGWRTLSGITNRRFSSADDVIEETSRALLLRLNDLYRRCYGNELNTTAGVDAGFVMGSRRQVIPTAMIGNAMLIVGIGNGPVAAAVQGEHYLALRQFLSAFLTQELGVTPGHAIIVPDDGYDAVPSLEELLLLGWQQNVSHLIWKHYLVTITESAMRRWVGSIRTELSGAVAVITGTDQGGEVYYKRYRPPLLLTPQAMQLVRRFRLSPSLSELTLDAGPEKLAEILRLFGREKLIRFYATELLEEPEPAVTKQYQSLSDRLLTPNCYSVN